MSRHQSPEVVAATSPDHRGHAALRELYSAVTSGTVRDPRADPRMVLAAYQARLTQQLAHERFITAFDIAEVLEASGHDEPARIVRDAARDAGVPDTRILIDLTQDRLVRPGAQGAA